MSTESLHDQGLKAATAFLERIGMQVIETNYPTLHGEIPLLAIDDETLVHVTVETRRQTGGSPNFPEADAAQHRARLQEYMYAYGLDQPIRFDAITILVLGEDRALLRHHRDAYGHEDWVAPSDRPDTEQE